MAEGRAVVGPAAAKIGARPAATGKISTATPAPTGTGTAAARTGASAHRATAATASCASAATTPAACTHAAATASTHAPATSTTASSKSPRERLGGKAQQRGDEQNGKSGECLHGDILRGSFVGK